MGSLAKIKQKWKSPGTGTLFEIPTDHPAVCMNHKQTKERTCFGIKLNRRVTHNRYMASVATQRIAKNGMLIKCMVLVMCLLMDTNAQAADMPAIGKDHCGGCHEVEKKLYAPSFRDIANKYRGDADAFDKLTENINRGGMFGWNTGMRMPAKGLGAFDREVKGMVEFILGLPISNLSLK